MKKCPACQHEVDLFAAECDSCGIIFAKWEARHVEGTDPSAPSTSSTDIPPDGLPPLPPVSEQIIDDTVKHASGKGLYILLALIALLVLGGLFWAFTGGRGFQSGSGEVSYGGPCPTLGTGDEFERVVPIPGEPQGLAWGNGEFLIGNRVKPWGFVRLDCQGKSTVIPVADPIQKQNINFWCVAFNGVEYVSYTDGRWVGSPSPDAFIVHDPKSLAILRHFPAPPKIGGLTWDGANYWAGTRKNTAEEPGESWLYKLDDRFNVVQKWEAPVSGCQGLCSVNGLLFWTDVFTDQVVIFRIEAEKLVKVHEYEDANNYLSGIAWDGENLWVSEYQTNRLRMLPKRLTDSWFAGDFRVPNYMVCKVARILLAYDAGNTSALGLLLAFKSRGLPNAEQLHMMCNALDALGVRGAMIRVMDALLSDDKHADLHPLLLPERQKWMEGAPAPSAPAPEATPTPIVTAESPTLAVPPSMSPVATPALSVTPTP